MCLSLHPSIRPPACPSVHPSSIHPSIPPPSTPRTLCPPTSPGGGCVPPAVRGQAPGCCGVARTQPAQLGDLTPNPRCDLEPPLLTCPPGTAWGGLCMHCGWGCGRDGWRQTGCGTCGWSQAGCGRDGWCQTGCGTCGWSQAGCGRDGWCQTGCGTCGWGQRGCGRDGWRQPGGQRGFSRVGCTPSVCQESVPVAGA
uniref:Uncharacterized protein n=1 Tax=Accipiter nisus TaxID=211598 RepID=A0A8B9NH52_9AVES